MIFHDPLVGSIDCSEVMPIIEHPLFQRLGFVRQLGLSHLIFRHATHTRLEHSIGAYGRTKRRTELWRKWGIIDKDTARDIEIYALIHDIGHGPYSHAIEAVTRVNHDEHGLELVEELQRAIKQSGGNPDRIKKFFTRRDNLYKAVHDKNLGTEKFDYLERDAAYTHSGRPQFRDLPFHITFIKGDLVVPDLPGLWDAALGIQHYYMGQYKDVYLQCDCMILQRGLQKSTFAMINEGELTEAQLWPMTDARLDAAIFTSKQEWIRQFAGAIEARKWPRVAISIKQKHFEESDRYNESGKRKTSVFAMGAKRMKRLAKYFDKNPRRLDNIEKEIETAFSLPEHSVLVVPAMDSYRFKAQQVMVQKSNEISSLAKWRPEGVNRLNEIALSYMCLRIAVAPEHREKIASKQVSHEVVKFLLSKAA